MLTGNLSPCLLQGNALLNLLTRSDHLDFFTLSLNSETTFHKQLCLSVRLVLRWLVLEVHAYAHALLKQ